MRRALTVFKILLIFTIVFQSCSKEEDSYINLTDEAKELLLYEIGDTFLLKNTITDEIITLTVDGKTIDYYENGGTPGSIYSGLGGDSFYEYGRYSFSDETGCYNGSVSIEARSGGNFEFRIFTGECFGEFLATPEFNSLGFEFDGEIVSINVNGIEFTETYVLNTVNNAFVNTIFYTKENGIVQINDNQSTIFTLAQ
jgi:hypothetical protein